ncbi:MAG UNVERIFIED_CONTAM: hypothetical protein MIO30_01525 [Methylobacterium ajmalii]|mgnify:CR=1 FL=1|jgi:hypothetical protein|uniref:Uncharacterized protein n=3 Tax=Methylobacteriaceae TaxID=119045 RepID=A0A0C6FKC3_9HYPH|nr:hypothetical protein [Methylobacterium ajmalii]MBK3420980.1 hypothetical protein [Methylobacterium ajmalii]BAQ45584.1 hypothetical protein Maq22A_c11665 [Methylobacterium aquaticum]SFE12975.1 hypothetical protein SAMN04487844_101129 [Methylobacterium sp. yr596]
MVEESEMAERRDESAERDKARRDKITADDLKGVAAVPQDGDGEANTSGANAGDRQKVEADPGTG